MQYICCESPGDQLQKSIQNAKILEDVHNAVETYNGPLDTSLQIHTIFLNILEPAFPHRNVVSCLTESNTNKYDRRIGTRLEQRRNENNL